LEEPEVKVAEEKMAKTAKMALKEQQANRVNQDSPALKVESESRELKDQSVSSENLVSMVKRDLLGRVERVVKREVKETF